MSITRMNSLKKAAVKMFIPHIPKEVTDTSDGTFKYVVSLNNESDHYNMFKPYFIN